MSERRQSFPKMLVEIKSLSEAKTAFLFALRYTKAVTFARYKREWTPIIPYPKYESFYHTGKNQSALAILVHVIVSRLFSSGETNGYGMKPPMKIMTWNLDVNRRFRPSKSIHSFNENNKLFSNFFFW